jgi:hypothetical protein
MRVSCLRTFRPVSYGVSLDEPPAIVAFDERADHLPCLLQTLEVVEIHALLAQTSA